MIPTFLPRLFKAYARFAVTVDLPTPPLPLATPIYFTSLAKIEVESLFN
jgi:hypothetical protein